MVIDPEAPPIRPQRHVPNSISTIRRELNLHRNKDVTLGEDAYTNRKDHAPRNIFTFNAIVLELAAYLELSPKIAIERCQDDKNLAIAWVGA